MENQNQSQDGDTSPEGAQAAVGATGGQSVKPKQSRRQRVSEIITNSLLNDTQKAVAEMEASRLRQQASQQTDAEARRRDAEIQLAQVTAELRKSQKLLEIQRQQIENLTKQPGAGYTLAGLDGRGDHQGSTVTKQKFEPRGNLMKMAKAPETDTRFEERQQIGGPPRYMVKLGAPLGASTPFQLKNGDDLRPMTETSRTQANGSHLQQSSYHRLPALPIPVYKKGDSWDEYLIQYYQTARLVGMEADMLLPYLKANITEEGRQTLVKMRIESLADAVAVLDDLYRPVVNPLAALDDLKQVTQRPGEALTSLAARIQSMANEKLRFLSTHMTEEEVQTVVCNSFVQALRNPQTSSFLDFEMSKTQLSLNDLLCLGQGFENRRSTSDTKRGLRTTEEDQEMKQLRAQVDELQKTLQEVLSGKRESSAPGRGGTEKEAEKPRRPRKTFQCWNCGEPGHQRRDCTKEKIGDGYTYRTPRQRRYSRQRSVQPESQTLN